MILVVIIGLQKTYQYPVLRYQKGRPMVGQHGEACLSAQHNDFNGRKVFGQFLA